MFAKRTFSVECFPVNDGNFHQLGPGGSLQESCLKDPSLIVCAGFIGSHRKSFTMILKTRLLHPLPWCAEVLGVFCCQCMGVAWEYVCGLLQFETCRVALVEVCTTFSEMLRFIALKFRRCCYAIQTHHQQFCRLGNFTSSNPILRLRFVVRVRARS